MRQIIELGKVDYNGSGRKNCLVTLEVELEKTIPNVAPYLDTDLRSVKDTEIFTLSISGNVWNPRKTDLYEFGQNVEVIRGFFPKNKDVQRLCDLWDRWHLNGMKAGTTEQNKALEDVDHTGITDWYGYDCEHLEDIGLLYVPIPEDVRASFSYKAKNGELPTHYKYGSAWLTERIPDDVIQEIQEIIGRLPGKS